MGHFDDKLLPGERVLLRARKTTMILADTIMLTFLTAGFLVCVYTLGWFVGFGSALQGIIAFSPLIIALLLLINDIVGFLYLEIVVTNMRVLGKKGLAAMTVLDAPIKRIQDMRVDISIVGGVFDYGTIKITTANGEFVYEKVHDPLRIRNTINNMLHQ
jgi:uncharacterized membrane protein YdbT with pleckstrin-like domain